MLIKLLSITVILSLNPSILYAFTSTFSQFRDNSCSQYSYEEILDKEKAKEAEARVCGKCIRKLSGTYNSDNIELLIKSSYESTYKGDNPYENYKDIQATQIALSMDKYKGQIQKKIKYYEDLRGNIKQGILPKIKNKYTALKKLALRRKLFNAHEKSYPDFSQGISRVKLSASQKKYCKDNGFIDKDYYYACQKYFLAKKNQGCFEISPNCSAKNPKDYTKPKDTSTYDKSALNFCEKCLNELKELQEHLQSSTPETKELFSKNERQGNSLLQ